MKAKGRRNNSAEEKPHLRQHSTGCSSLYIHHVITNSSTVKFPTISNELIRVKHFPSANPRALHKIEADVEVQMNNWVGHSLPFTMRYRMMMATINTTASTEGRERGNAINATV
jgi:hypothetical protein